MESKYFYNGEDITIDMMFKIEHIVNILAEREHKDFDQTLAEFLASETYKPEFRIRKRLKSYPVRDNSLVEK